MKKSQILAALALAFSLGVVAPVAGLASAIDHTAQSATCGEVSHVIDVIESDTTYKDMLKLYNDIQTYTTGANATMTETTAASAIRTALGFAAASPAVAVTAMPSATANLETTLSFVNNGNIENFDTYNGINDAIKAQTSASLANFKVLVARYNEIPGVTPIIANRTWVDWAAVVADANIYDSATSSYKFQNWTQYKALFDAVDAADTFTDGMTALDGDLIGVGVTRADITAANITTANGYKALVTPLGSPATAIQIKYDNYVGNATTSLRAKMNAALVCSQATENGDRDNGTHNVYGFLTGIAGALRSAENGKYGDKNDDQIIDLLLGAAPIINNPDEPGTNEPGTEEPGSDDPSAPGTGLVSTAEGNAATTVSIVAGLATALTALGAGVVAYRSARRSEK